MPKPTIVLDEQLEQFVGNEVISGRYATANDVVSAGLELLRQR